MKNLDQDLSLEKPSSESTAPTVKPYDADEFRDRVRQNIAYRLLWLLVGCAGLVAYCLIFLRQVEGAKDIAVMLFTPLLTAVSSILGFYFGERSASRKK